MTAYDEIVEMYRSHPEYGELGIFAGYGEFDEPTPYEIKVGLDGKLYAVFCNSGDRDSFAARCPDLFRGCVPASFGQFDNAFQLD